MKLLGIGAAAAAVTSQLPASQIPPISAVNIPVTPLAEEGLPLECQMEEECLVVEEPRPNSNPYALTKADIGLSDKGGIYMR
jgi:hypothetical protein